MTVLLEKQVWVGMGLDKRWQTQHNASPPVTCEFQLSSVDTSGQDPADVRIPVSARPLVVGWKNGFP